VGDGALLTGSLTVLQNMAGTNTQVQVRCRYIDTLLPRPITRVSLPRLPFYDTSLHRLTLACLPTSLPNDIVKNVITSTAHKSSVIR
jgi:hypothetical protein